MSLFGKTEKTCATCIHWKGNRCVEFEYVDTVDFEGKCGFEPGYYDISTTDSSSCSDWEGFVKL